jgi:CMP/dCMP kinase
MSNNKIPVITIDGPTSSGKGTVGQRLAKKLGWHFLDSGAVYRVLALEALKNAISIREEEKLVTLALDLDFEIKENAQRKLTIFLDGEDVTRAIRQEGCGAFASEISVIPQVRAALNRVFLRFRKPPGLVADGRDMGTVVFPDAKLKVFLTASPEVRAERRRQQLQGQGINVNLLDVLVDLKERDERDQSREVAPLKPAEDAKLLVTDQLSLEAVVAKIIALLP